MEIRSVAAIVPGPQGLDALAATAAPTPVQPVANALDPPVKLDLGSGARDARYVRDSDTRAMVFEVVDPGSGEVIVQLPSETVLRNRAYEDTARARTAQAGRISQVA